MRQLISLILVFVFLSGCNPAKNAEPQAKATPQELSSNLFDSILKLDFASVDILIKNVADLSLYDSDGYTPLMRAAQMKNFIMVEKLINAQAKLLQPLKSDETITVFNFITDSNNDILSLLEKEKLKALEQVQSLIVSKNFNDAQGFIINNFIPRNSEIPQSNGKILDFTILNADSALATSFLIFLINPVGHDQIDLVANADSLRLVSSKIKDPDFFIYILDLYNEKWPLHDLGKITDEDGLSVIWVTIKINTLTSKNSRVDFESLKTFVLNYNLTNSLTNKDEYLILTESILRNPMNTADRNGLMQIILSDTLDKSIENVEYLTLVLNLTEVWKNSKLPDTGYPFDNLSVKIIKAIEGSSFSLNLVTEVTEGIFSFAPDMTKNADETLKLIVSGTFSSGQRQNLLNLILPKINELPENIFSFAIESGGISSLQTILASGVRFEPNNQQEAVYQAVVGTRSGDAARAILVLLKENGISISTQSGVKTILFTIDKLINDKDTTYQSVFDFLISANDSPLGVMGHDELLSMLSTVFKSVREKKSGWALISQIIEKVDTNGFDGSERIRRSMTISGESPVDILVSISWDYILTLFEIYSVDESQLGAMSLSLKSFLEKFSLDTFSMSILSDSQETNQERFLSQNLLPLSILLSTPNDKWGEILNKFNISTSKKIFQAEPSNLSLWSFFQEPFYKNFGERTDFWEMVTSKLIQNKNAYNQPASPSTIKFYKFLIAGDFLLKFPSLADRLKDLKLNLSSNLQKQCIINKSHFDDSKPDNLSVQESYADGNISITGGTPSIWTSLGSFEAVLPLKAKSCSGESLDSFELVFVKNFISNNLGKNIASDNLTNGILGPTPRSTKKCSRIGNSSYSWNYSWLGTPLKPDPNSVDKSNLDLLSMTDVFDECYVFSHDESIHYQAKITFLSQWFKCVSNSSDQPTIRFFESIKEFTGIEPNDSNNGINICGW